RDGFVDEELAMIGVHMSVGQIALRARRRVSSSSTPDQGTNQAAESSQTFDEHANPPRRTGALANTAPPARPARYPSPEGPARRSRKALWIGWHRPFAPS